MFATENTIIFGRSHNTAFDRTPLEANVTAFHIFLMYDDRVVVLNQPCGMPWKPLQGKELTEYDYADRLSFEPFKQRRTRGFRGFSRDEARRKMYVYNNQGIWLISIENEHASQWRLFFERACDTEGDTQMRQRYFHAAFNLAKLVPQQKEIVAYALGNFYLQQVAYDRATTVFRRVQSV